MDEIYDPQLHQWLSLCRLAMIEGPHMAAFLVNRFINPLIFHSTYSHGWNEVSHNDVLSEIRFETVYVNIDSAQTRRTPPPDVAPEAIHKVQISVPDVVDTKFWTLIKAQAETLSRHNHEVYTPQRITKIMQSIREAGPLGKIYDTNVMKERVRTALRAMQQAMTATQQGRLSMGDFLMPAIDTIKAYLAFELPGIMAREVLAVILSTQCQIPILGPPDATPLQARVDAAEHLGNLAYRLLQQRETANVTSYYELTYLASLYAGTAHVLAGHALEIGGLPPHLIKRMKGLDFNLDEMAAHNLIPTFELPGLFSSYGILELIISESAVPDTSPQEHAKSYCIHPGLQQLLGSFQEMDEKTVNRAYQQFSATSQPIDIQQKLLEDYSPIAQSNYEQIQFDFAAIAMGGRMRDLNNLE